jgi:divalent metal cation (Fe/Co/Zn/Cd) transporter
VQRPCSWGVVLECPTPDPQHPFGYGKEHYFWPLMAAISMFIIGASFSVFRGMERIIAPHNLQDIQLNYVVLGVSALFDGTSFFLAFTHLRKQLVQFGLWQAIRVTKDPILFSVFFEDSAGLLGLALAFLGLFLYQVTGMVIFDSLASILVGLLLGGVALLLGYESRSLLLGEAASPETRIFIECETLRRARQPAGVETE